MDNIQIFDYTEKSFVVIGDTRPIKDDLKSIGGRFNPNLTIDDERVAGWVFSKNKRLEVEDLINGERDNFTENFLKVMNQCIFKSLSTKTSHDRITIKGLTEDVDNEIKKYTNKMIASGECNGCKIVVLNK
jgi:hypothetical protein